MKFHVLLFTFFYLIAGSAVGQSWTQLGSDLDGVASGDYSGWVVCMPDASTVAISSYRNSNAGTASGLVRVFSWDGTSWVQKGTGLTGEQIAENAGYSMHMPDANTIAIGADKNNDNGTEAGQVRVYSWDGNDWIQKGSDLNGEAKWDHFGYAVNMSDANTLAVGADRNDDSGTNAGEVKIFKWNGSDWIAKGQDIGGEATSDQSGRSLSMPDSNTIAIGAPFNDGGGTSSGHARVFSWDGNSWIQKGNDIDGESSGDFSVNLSMPDPNTIAFGSAFSDDGGYEAGQARVFEWNGSTWVQKGSDIEGQAEEHFGWSVSMPNANTLAIGAYNKSRNGLDAGFVSIYSWDGTNWVQVGGHIEGTSNYERTGYSVSMPDANTVAIGAPNCSDLGTYWGRTRVYTISSIGMGDEIRISNTFKVYPNPSKGQITVELDKSYQDIHFQLSDINGQMVLEGASYGSNSLKLEIDSDPGLYLLRLNCDDRIINLKLMLE